MWGNGNHKLCRPFEDFSRIKISINCFNLEAANETSFLFVPSLSRLQHETGRGTSSAFEVENRAAGSSTASIFVIIMMRVRCRRGSKCLLLLATRLGRKSWEQGRVLWCRRFFEIRVFERLVSGDSLFWIVGQHALEEIVACLRQVRERRAEFAGPVVTRQTIGQK